MARKTRKPRKLDWEPPIPEGVSNEDYFRLRADQVCSHCRQKRTKDGHDPCIANLPGADFACCGHGVHEGYVVFSNGKVLRGQFDGMPLSDFPHRKT